MTISIIGTTGVLGRHVVPRLLERGHDVKAVVRSHEHAGQLRHLIVQVFMGDILVKDTLPAVPEGSDCVLHLATAVPGDVVRGDWTINDRIRREGTRNLLEPAKENGIRRYVQQSNEPTRSFRSSETPGMAES